MVNKQTYKTLKIILLINNKAVYSNKNNIINTQGKDVANKQIKTKEVKQNKTKQNKTK